MVNPERRLLQGHFILVEVNWSGRGRACSAEIGYTLVWGPSPDRQPARCYYIVVISGAFGQLIGYARRRIDQTRSVQNR
ncbi:MAG: hypothetical protein ACYDC5_04735 [Candidatus Dormibacteria bacterium]